MKRNCILNIILIFLKWPLLPLLKNCTDYWFILGKKHLFYSQADSLSGLKYISRVMHRPIQVIKLGDYHEILILLIWLHELSSLLMKLLYTCRSFKKKLRKKFNRWNLTHKLLSLDGKKKKKKHIIFLWLLNTLVFCSIGSEFGNSLLGYWAVQSCFYRNSLIV